MLKHLDSNTEHYRQMQHFNFFQARFIQIGLREDDYPQRFLGFKLRVAKISVTAGHMYCSICESNKL